MSEPAPSAADDDALIQALARGGAAREQAVTLLYQRYAHRFRSHLLRQGCPRDRVDDLLQEAFIRLLQRCEGFKPQGQGRAWIWTVARSAWLDHYRRRDPVDAASAVEEHLGEAWSISRDLAGQAAFRDCLSGQFSRFSAEYPEGGQALAWAVVDGLSMREIAELLGRTAGATREFLSQTRKRLHSYVAVCLE